MWKSPSIHEEWLWVVWCSITEFVAWSRHGIVSESWDCQISTWKSIGFLLNNQRLFSTKEGEGRWDETAFGVEQGRSCGEQRVSRNTDRLIRLPMRRTIVSRLISHLLFLCNCTLATFFLYLRSIVDPLMMVSWKMAACLAAGNTVVLKPAAVRGPEIKFTIFFLFYTGHLFIPFSHDSSFIFQRIMSRFLLWLR